MMTDSRLDSFAKTDAAQVILESITIKRRCAQNRSNRAC